MVGDMEIAEKFLLTLQLGGKEADQGLGCGMLGGGSGMSIARINGAKEKDRA